MSIMSSPRVMIGWDDGRLITGTGPSIDDRAARGIGVEPRARARQPNGEGERRFLRRQIIAGLLRRRGCPPVREVAHHQVSCRVPGPAHQPGSAQALGLGRASSTSGTPGVEHRPRRVAPPPPTPPRPGAVRGRHQIDEPVVARVRTPPPRPARWCRTPTRTTRRSSWQRSASLPMISKCTTGAAMSVPSSIGPAQPTNGRGHFDSSPELGRAQGTRRNPGEVCRTFAMRSHGNE